MKMRFGMAKRCISLVLSAALLFLLVPAAAFAADASSDTWDNHVAWNFAGGSGTEDDPYQISTPEELALLASDINSARSDRHYSGAYFKLTADLDLSAYRWIPIGNGQGYSSFQSFQGIFDGDGHTITGLYVNETEGCRVAGLFGHLNGGHYNAEIKNLTVSGAQIITWNTNVDYDNDPSMSGILAADATGSNVRIENCHVSGTVTGVAYAGGMTGYSLYAAYENCSADVTVVGYAQTGGFVGVAYDSSFQDCSVKGTVSSRGWTTGGFAGHTLCNTEVSHCLSSCKVSGDDWNTGGFVGYAEEGTTICNSVASGDVHSTVTGWNPKVGGFAGVNNASTIQNCHAGGTVTTAHTSIPAGGFLGAFEGDAVTEDCSFDKHKNENLSGVGGTGSSGTIGISGAATDKVGVNICQDYYGGHSYSSEWTVDTEADCTKAGSKSHHCVRCGEKEDITEIPAAGHSFTRYVSDHNATCMENGTETAACDICGKKDVREIAGSALGHHVYDNDEDSECNICGYKRVVDKPAATTRLQQTGLTEVPEGLKDTAFHTVDKIQNELLRRITAEGGYTSQNADFYDIKLLLSTDGGSTWQDADEENFPAEGITILIPYPAGTGKDNYDFMVTHMFTVTSEKLGIAAGDVEQPQVKKLDEGIQVTLKGLSPVCVAWKEIPKSSSAVDGTQQAGNNQQTQGDPQTGGGTQQADNSTQTQKELQTGDDSTLWLWTALLLICGAGAVYTRKFLKTK